MRSPRESRPTEPRAVALRYDRGSSEAQGGDAPQVVAKGRGVLAERILEIAREHDVPVRSDRDLVELLSACELGDEIPIEVWGASARSSTGTERTRVASGLRLPPLFLNAHAVSEEVCGNRASHDFPSF